VNSFAYVVIPPAGMLSARREAARRNAEARVYKMRTGTNHQAGLSGALADEVGAVCELAVSIFTGLPHRFGDDYSPTSADVGPIEVRGRKLGSAYHDVRVYQSDTMKAHFIVGATIMEQSNVAKVRLNGWAYTLDAWENSTPANFDPHPVKGPARWHSVTLLQPMATLHLALENYLGGNE
jgi:hypothetical protein